MTTEEIHNICLKYNITNYTINDDLSIDVDGDVNLCYMNLRKFHLKFRNVTGWFDCSYANLTSLEGSPSFVGGDFYCYSNSLEYLNGSPSKVSGVFNCSDNKLTSLEGAPSSVGEGFDCSMNYLKSLKGIPSDIKYENILLPAPFTYNDYLAYFKVVERDLKFKKLLK